MRNPNSCPSLTFLDYRWVCAFKRGRGAKKIHAIALPAGKQPRVNMFGQLLGGNLFVSCCFFCVFLFKIKILKKKIKASSPLFPPDGWTARVLRPTSSGEGNGNSPLVGYCVLKLGFSIIIGNN